MPVSEVFCVGVGLEGYALSGARSPVVRVPRRRASSPTYRTGRRRNRPRPSGYGTVYRSPPRGAARPNMLLQPAFRELARRRSPTGFAASASATGISSALIRATISTALRRTIDDQVVGLRFLATYSTQEHRRLPSSHSPTSPSSYHKCSGGFGRYFP